MSEFTLLHTADWHVCDDFYNDAATCLEYLTRIASTMQPDLIVISGDIYESRQIRQESRGARLAIVAIRELADLAPVAIVLGTPSHDGNAPLLLTAINERYPVWIADQPESTTIYREEKPIAYVSALPAFTKQYFQTSSNIEDADKEVTKALTALFAKFGADYQRHVIKARHAEKKQPFIPHILLGHWQTIGAYIHPDQPISGLEIEIPRTHIELAKAAIACLGHLHAAQKVEPNIWYPGSLFPTDFGETEKKGFWVHDLELVDYGHHWEVVNSDFMETPAPHLKKAVRNLIHEYTEDSTLVTPAILGTLSEVQPDENMILRMEVTLYQDMTMGIDADQIKDFVIEKLKPRKFDLIVNALPRPNVRSARVLEEEQLREKLKIRADIINEPIDEDILRKADALQDFEREELLETVQKEVVL
jgi:exonuclease SbcD